MLPPSRDVLLSRQACRVGCRHCRSGGSCLSAASLRVRSWAPHWGAAHADISPVRAGTWWACSPPQGLPWWALEALPVALVQPRLCVHNRSDTFLCTQCCLSPFQTTTLTARRDTRIDRPLHDMAAVSWPWPAAPGFALDICSDPISCRRMLTCSDA